MLRKVIEKALISASVIRLTGFGMKQNVEVEHSAVRQFDDRVVGEELVALTLGL